jgi:hypothetical protein
MKQTSRFLAAFLAALLTCSIAALAQTPNLGGSYALDPGSAGSVGQAIKNVTSQMGFFKRGIAQQRLTETNQPPQRLVITQTTTDITIQPDGGQAIRTSMDGAPVTVTRGDGSQVQVASMWQGATLQRSFTASDGVRVNRYSLDASGATLTMDVQLTSPDLPQPLTYQLVYHRSS